MISYSILEKRKAIHNATKDNSCLNEAGRILDRYSDLGDKSDLEKLIKYSSIHAEAADTYFDEIVRGANRYHELMDTVVESIVPLVDYNSSDYTNFPEIYKALRLNEKMDNIVRNHSMIQEKYDIEGSFTTLNKVLEFNDLAEIVASTVNIFTNVPVRGRVQIALQEFFYLANRNGVKYDDKIVTETIVDTIVAANPNTNDTIQQIDTTVKNNECIDTSKAEPQCGYFGASSIRDYADCFSNDLANKIRHIDQIYYKIKNSCHGELDQEFKDAMKYLTDKMIDVIKVSAEDGVLNSNDIAFLRNLVNKAIDKQVFMANKVALLAPNIIQNFTYLLGLMRTFKDELDVCYNDTYSKSNINTMNEAVEWDKIFKRENLIHALSVADGRLKKKFKEINDGARKKIKKAADWIFDRDSKVEEAVLVDGSVDYVVESWLYDDEDSAYIREEAEKICKEINTTDLYNSNYSLYYNTLSGLVEFHLISTELCSMQEGSYNIDYVPSYLASYIESLLEYSYILEDLRVPEEDDITEFLKNNPEYSSSVVQLANYAGYDKDTVENILIRTSAYRDDDQEEETKQEFDNYMSTPIGDFYTNMEAAHMLSDIVFSEDFYEDEDDDILDDFELDDEEYLEEKQMVKITKHPDPNKVPKDKPTMKTNVQNNFSATKVDVGNDKDTKEKDDDKEEKKEKKPIIDINKLKLTLMGFKKNIKDLDAKAQQAARNSDVAFNQFVMNVKKMLVSDRREAIIKGSVIPSFHRCVLASIGLGGLAIINPIYAIIALIGGIAISKSLTKKERALLMDDIAVEIEVIDKEIQNAEAKNQSKKLRALLKTKKQLQRQYQRIRYNIRIGKDIVPDSGVGTPGNE